MGAMVDRTISMSAASSSDAASTIQSLGTVPRSRYFLFAAIAVFGCASDLVTKALCFSSQHLRAGEIIWQWPGHAGIQLSRNPGALFGIGPGMIWLFAALSIIAAIAIPVWLFWFRAARDGWLTFALGCVMAGILGNLYDRLGMSGETWLEPRLLTSDAVYYVRDWILWQLNDRWRWPNFNIADSFLVIGVGLLVLHAVIYSEPAREQTR
jgi:signal peptidase II